jgi:quinol monooxygenase YgiN
LINKEVGVGVKFIVEFTARPGQRDELISLIERMMDGPPMPGSLGATFYKAVDDPDTLVEIADWDSADARKAVMKELQAADALAPMIELLAAPPRETLVEPLH